MLVPISRLAAAPEAGRGFLADGSANAAFRIRGVAGWVEDIQLSLDDLRALTPPSLRKGLRYDVPGPGPFARALVGPEGATRFAGEVIQALPDRVVVRLGGWLESHPGTTASRICAEGLLVFSPAGELLSLVLVCDGESGSRRLRGLLEWRRRTAEELPG